MTPTFLFLLLVSCGLIGFGAWKIVKTWNKARLVKCTFCDSVMDKDDFKQHADTHIRSSETSKKILNFKMWALNELEKDELYDEAEMVKKGAVVCGLSPNTIRPLLRAIVLSKQRNEDLDKK